MPSGSRHPPSPSPARVAVKPPPRGLGAWIAGRRLGATPARPALLRPARPIVTFTFDGAPRSAARTGAALLENIGARGTFYASGAFAGRPSTAGPMFDAEDVARLLAAGHEIGCRTFSGGDSRRARASDLHADMVRNADALAALGMEARLVSFAWPHGRAPATLRAALPQRFTSGRGMARGLASGAADLAELRANPLYGLRALQRCLALMEAARRQKGWVIFHAQDVGPRPSPYGAHTGLMERLCGSAYAGGMRVMTMKDALAAVLRESQT